jgi:hypothetical protein
MRKLITPISSKIKISIPSIDKKSIHQIGVGTQQRKKLPMAKINRKP